MTKTERFVRNNIADLKSELQTPCVGNADHTYTQGMLAAYEIVLEQILEEKVAA